MGKEKDIAKSEKKKKRKDKDRDAEEASPKRKNIYSDSEEEIQTHNEKEKSKASNKNIDISMYESPRKKSKKDKECLDNEMTVKKGKKDKYLIDLGIKKKLGDSPSKKAKKNISLRTSDSEDDDDVDHGAGKISKQSNEVVSNDIISSDNHIIEEEIGWTKEDVVMLLQRIDSHLPDKDSLKYSSRVEKLDWSEIKFNDHSQEECKEKWKIIEKKVRGFRILQEMIGDAKLWVEKPWSNFYSSQKKKRHPDMPKRPLSSYMLFYMAKKAKIAKKHPNIGMTDLSKLVANKFHKLSESKKEKYSEKARCLREEYHEKMQMFLNSHPNEGLSVKKKKEQKNQMPGPPRPAPPIKLFIEEKLKHFKDVESKLDAINQIKEMWRHLSNKKKVPWIRWAHENEKKYLEELEIYKSENPNFEMPNIKSLLSKEEITILERMEGKPEKPPNSAYSLFSRLMLKDDQIKLMKFSPKERMREISRLWAAVSDEDKKQYQAKAKHLLDIYKLEYATYLESLTEEKRLEELAKTLGRKRKKKGVVETSSNGKKLKQTKIVEAFKKEEKKKDVAVEKAPTSDEESEDEDVENNPQKIDEIRKKIELLEPQKPGVDPFVLFREIYLTNPGNKESKARMVWDSMPKKEKERYKKKLESQKQNYILKYKEFLTKLKPHEIKVYSKIRNASFSNNLLSSSEGEESDDEAEETASNDENKLKILSTHKTEDSSTDSEDSD